MLDVEHFCAHVWVVHENGFKQLATWLADVLRPIYLEFHDIFECLLNGAAGKRIESADHFAEHHTPTPNVAFVRVPYLLRQETTLRDPGHGRRQLLLVNNLWRHVLRSSALGKGPALFFSGCTLDVLEHLGESKVHEHQVACLVVQHKILRLDVSVDYAVFL